MSFLINWIKKLLACCNNAQDKGGMNCVHLPLENLIKHLGQYLCYVYYIIFLNWI